MAAQAAIPLGGHIVSTLYALEPTSVPGWNVLGSSKCVSDGDGTAIFIARMVYKYKHMTLALNQ
jgi:hypothetical protein